MAQSKFKYLLRRYVGGCKSVRVFSPRAIIDSTESEPGGWIVQHSGKNIGHPLHQSSLQCGSHLGNLLYDGNKLAFILGNKIVLPSLSGLALGPVSDQSPRRRSLFTGGADLELIFREPDELGLESVALAVISCE